MSQEQWYSREGSLLTIALPSFISDLEVDNALRPLNDLLPDRTLMKVMFDLTGGDLYETVCGRVMEYARLVERHGKCWEVFMTAEQLQVLDPAYASSLRPRVPAMAAV